MYYVHKFLIILNAINSNLFKYLCFYLAFEEVHAVMLNMYILNTANERADYMQGCIKVMHVSKFLPWMFRSFIAVVTRAALISSKIRTRG